VSRSAVFARQTDRALLAAATLVAAVATAGSLSLSLGLGLVPCRLCWYQRILMYPLVVVLGAATIEGRPSVARTVLPLSLLGIVVAAYHSWLQVSSGATCSVGGCAAVQLRVLGLTIPNLSLVAFVLVTLATVGGWRLGAT
jgi:disulfide bond formation protein DsbB